MCALVLALRNVPIYGPGGGDPALGNANNPSFSVSLEPAVARRNIEKAAKDKEAKRLVNKQQLPNSDDTSSNATYVSGRQTEGNAVRKINLRDTNTDPRDDAWNSRDDSSSIAGAGGSDEDRQRASLEEVRGLLKRESKRGRRQAAGLSPVSESTFPPPPKKQYAPVPPPLPLSTNIGSSTAAAMQSTPNLAYVPGNAFSTPPPKSPARPSMHRRQSEENVRPSTAGSKPPSP